MTNIRVLDTGKKLPADLSENLRELANKVDRGEITEFVAGYVINGEYEFLYPSSLNDSMILTSIMQHLTADKYLIR